MVISADIFACLFRYFGSSCLSPTIFMYYCCSSFFMLTFEENHIIVFFSEVGALELHVSRTTWRIFIIHVSIFSILKGLSNKTTCNLVTVLFLIIP